MSAARSIGDLIAPILKSAADIAGLQLMIRALETDAERKWIIMFWWERGVISDDEAELLIEANSLEAA